VDGRCHALRASSPRLCFRLLGCSLNSHDGLTTAAKAFCDGYNTVSDRYPMSLCDRARMAGIKDLRLHDLRRTMGSWQAGTGANLSVIGRSLNHKLTPTTAIYVRVWMTPVSDSAEVATTAMLEAAARGDKRRLKQRPGLKSNPSMRAWNETRASRSFSCPRSRRKTNFEHQEWNARRVASSKPCLNRIHFLRQRVPRNTGTQHEHDARQYRSVGDWFAPGVSAIARRACG
jgi:hypothetical protein